MAADTTLEKPLPNNLEAERSVLGAILLDNHALNAALETLRPEDFFLDQHRRVFTHMIALGESQQAIDLVTLSDELHCKGELEASGGAPYLASLAIFTLLTAIAATFVYYAQANLVKIELPDRNTRTDYFATLDLWQPIVKKLKNATLHLIETANHSYKVLKKTRTSPEDVFVEMAGVVRVWADSL